MDKHPSPRPVRAAPAHSPKRCRTRSRWLAVALATLASTAIGTVGELGPFAALDWRDGVTTSRSGYAIWISVPSTAHRATLPPYEKPATPPTHWAGLGTNCRVPGGGLPDAFPPQEATGEIYLDNHPDFPGAYTVFHPMHWILGLAGRDVERIPVRVEFSGAPAFDSALERPLTNYSAPRPGLSIPIPGDIILGILASGTPIDARVTGPNIEVAARFEPSVHARAAASLMAGACPGRPPTRAREP